MPVMAFELDVELLDDYNAWVLEQAEMLLSLLLSVCWTNAIIKNILVQFLVSML
jgi:hypothetical protein